MPAEEFDQIVSSVTWDCLDWKPPGANDFFLKSRQAHKISITTLGHIWANFGTAMNFKEFSNFADKPDTFFGEVLGQALRHVRILESRSSCGQYDARLQAFLKSEYANLIPQNNLQGVFKDFVEGGHNSLLAILLNSECGSKIDVESYFDLEECVPSAIRTILESRQAQRISQETFAETIVSAHLDVAKVVLNSPHALQFSSDQWTNILESLEWDYPRINTILEAPCSRNLSRAHLEKLLSFAKGQEAAELRKRIRTLRM